MNEEVPQSGVSSFFCVYDEPSADLCLHNGSAFGECTSPDVGKGKKSSCKQACIGFLTF